MRRVTTAIVALASQLLPNHGQTAPLCTPHQQIDPARLSRNYSDVVVAKRKRIDQLSEPDQCELVNLLDEMSIPIQCRDARKRVERSASQLSTAARALANCAEVPRRRDSCDHEFTQTRNAQSEFEAAGSAQKIACP